VTNFRRAATYVDEILKGAKVAQPAAHSCFACTITRTQGCGSILGAFRPCRSQPMLPDAKEISP
jgi:hypothetical protein